MGSVEEGWGFASIRRCSRCGRRLKKSEKLSMCERCRKETLKQFLAQTLDDIEVDLRKLRRKSSRETFS